MNSRKYLYKDYIIISLAIGLIFAAVIDYVAGINFSGPYFAICFILVMVLLVYVAIHKRRNRKQR